jgi:CRISPR-associated protein Cmr3
MLKFIIEPYDVLFFGSGKPFNIGDVANSVFPPFPNTFASAICSKIYHHFNINVSNILKAVYGPFFLKDNKLLLPKPANIYSKRKEKEIEKVFITELTNQQFNLFDFNNTNKPELIKQFYLYKGEEDVEPFNAFIYPEALSKWLNNTKEFTKDDIVLYNEIYEYEPRIGIKIDHSKDTVKEEDGLYRINFIRLKENIKILFWVEFNEKEFNKEQIKAKIQNQNLNDDFIYTFFNQSPKVLKLGGEMKNAKYEINKDNFLNYLIPKLKIQNNITINQGEIIELLFLSYGVFDFSNNERLPKIDGFEIISACFDNYTNIGIRSKNKGIKIKRAIPLGSILTLKATKNIELSPLAFITKQNNNSYSIVDVKNLSNPNMEFTVNMEFIGSNLVLIKKANIKTN